MMLIELTRTDGKTIYVNPAHVVGVGPHPADLDNFTCAKIYTLTAPPFNVIEVRGWADQIARQLGAEWPR